MPQEHEQQQRFWAPPISILQAFGKAVAIWLMMYLVTVHLYVAWKWDSHHADIVAKNETTTAVVTILENDTTAPTLFLEENGTTAAAAAATATVEAQQVERLEQLTTKLQEEIARTKELQRQVREMTLQMQQTNDRQQGTTDAASAIKLLLFAAQQQSKTTDEQQQQQQPNMHRPTHLEALWNLLHRTSSSNNINNNNNQGNPQDSATSAAAATAALQDQTTFRQMVRLASNDLVRNIQLQKDVDWAALKLALDSILLSTKDDMTAAATTIATASDADRTLQDSPSDYDDSNNNSCPPDTVTEEDLEDRVKKIRNVLKERRENHVIQKSDDATDQKGETVVSLPVAFPQTLERLEQFLQEQRVNKLMQQQQEVTEEKATTTGTGKQDCMQSQDVVPWLEAGLDAIYRRKDLRQAILYAIEESSSSSVDGIILDAELNEFTATTTRTNKKTRAAGATNHKSRTLRQVLDGPFLADSMVHFINVALDFVSGYNDRFDQFIDQLSAQDGNNNNNNNGNIGRMIVTRLLKASGRISLPNTGRLAHKQ